MEHKRRVWPWIGIFAFIFLLSQDFWFWDGELKLGPWNFPLRVYYFLLLQFLLAVALGVFILRSSRRERDESD
jgi:hypothetical protein